jgi:hypothetical protein
MCCPNPVVALRIMEAMIAPCAYKPFRQKLVQSFQMALEYCVPSTCCQIYIRQNDISIKLLINSTVSHYSITCNRHAYFDRSAISLSCNMHQSSFSLFVNAIIIQNSTQSCTETLCSIFLNILTSIITS